MSATADSGCSGERSFRPVEIPVPWGIIAGKEWGDPHGFPWLGIHGWLDNAGTFDLLAKDWPAGHKLLCIDCPGHGLSSHLPAGMMYHYLEANLVIERIARHLGWSRFSLLGHSMGAGMAAIYTAVFPEKVHSLIMVDLLRPVARSPDTVVDRTRTAVMEMLSLEERFGTNTVGKVYATEEEAYQRLLEGAVAVNGEGAVTEEAARIIKERGIRRSDCGKGWVFSRDLRQRVGSLYGLHHDFLDQFARNIKCPHLLIKAKGSPHYEGREKAQEVLRVYAENPLHEFRELEGNHHLHLNTPGVILPVIKDFIQRTQHEASAL